MALRLVSAVRKAANVRGSNHSFASAPATSGTEHTQASRLAMSQSTRNYEAPSCKVSPLPDEQCRLDQWANSSDEQQSSSSPNSSTPSRNTPQRRTSLTTPDDLEHHPYRDPEQLRTVYDRVGTIVGTAAHFDVSETTARNWLIHHEIYDPRVQGVSSVAAQLEELSPEDLGLPPLGERR